MPNFHKLNSLLALQSKLEFLCAASGVCAAVLALSDFTGLMLKSSKSLSWLLKRIPLLGKLLCWLSFPHSLPALLSQDCCASRAAWREGVVCFELQQPILTSNLVYIPAAAGNQHLNTSRSGTKVFLCLYQASQVDFEKEINPQAAVPGFSITAAERVSRGHFAFGTCSWATKPHC